VARELSKRLGLPYVELDAVFHQPGWGELPVEEFREIVAERAAGDGWVIDGNYSKVRDLVWQRADTVVWLDLARALVMRRIISRSLARVVLRRRLWNGNRERWRNVVSRDPAISIVAWAWTQHDAYKEVYGAAMTDPESAHLRFVRLQSPKEVKAFLSRAGDGDPRLTPPEPEVRAETPRPVSPPTSQPPKGLG
jgi:adenylate kinase family enzyme